MTKTPINSAILREHFMADYLEELDPELVYNNYMAHERVLDNPEQFPRANFEWLNILQTEVYCLLRAHPVYFNNRH